MAQQASTRDVVPGFGQAVKAKRDGMGLSQQQLAEKAGTHFTTVSKIEAEQRSPSLRLALDLADALGVSVDSLCGRGTPKAS